MDTNKNVHVVQVGPVHMVDSAVERALSAFSFVPYLTALHQEKLHNLMVSINWLCELVPLIVKWGLDWESPEILVEDGFLSFRWQVLDKELRISPLRSWAELRAWDGAGERVAGMTIDSPQELYAWWRWLFLECAWPGGKEEGEAHAAQM